MADLTPKTIAELPDDTSLSGTELFPVMDGSTSKKIALSTIRQQFMQTTGIPIADGSNLDDMLAGGTYAVTDASSMTGDLPPTDGYAYKLFVSRAYAVGSPAVPRLWQIAQQIGNPFKEHRRYYGSNGWSSWVTLDVPNVNSWISAFGNWNGSFYEFSATAGNSVQIDFANYDKALLILTGISNSVMGMYLVYCSSTGAFTIAEVAGASSITITGASNVLTVANGSSTYITNGLLIKY